MVLLLHVADDHLTVQLPLPDLSTLTQAELSALRTYLSAKCKEARKESSRLIGKVVVVRDLWLKTIALKGDATAEEREEVNAPFYQEAMKYPELFVSYAWANSLSTLDHHVWTAMMERSKLVEAEKSTKKPSRTT
jgi:hypothetical protein